MSAPHVAQANRERLHEANVEVKGVHPKAMPAILTTNEGYDV